MDLICIVLLNWNLMGSARYVSQLHRFAMSTINDLQEISSDQHENCCELDRWIG